MHHKHENRSSKEMLFIQRDIGLHTTGRYRQPINTYGLFGWHEFGFGFVWTQIQIHCLDKLKELDLDLAQIHLGFQGSKSMDLKSPHKPKNLEIPHLTLALCSQCFIGSRTITLFLPLFSVLLSLFLAARFVSLNSFLPLYPLYFSLSTKSES